MSTEQFLFYYEELDTLVPLTEEEARERYRVFEAQIESELIKEYKDAVREFEFAEAKIRAEINRQLGPPFRTGGLFLGVSSG